MFDDGSSADHHFGMRLHLLLHRSKACSCRWREMYRRLASVHFALIVQLAQSLTFAW
jgi:hypothetical protein